MPDEIETEEFAVTTLNVDGLPQEVFSTTVNPQGGTQLAPVEFSIDSAGYVRPDGTPLGDHFPQTAKFSIIKD